jgi:hypothetical protein
MTHPVGRKLINKKEANKKIKKRKRSGQNSRTSVKKQDITKLIKNTNMKVTFNTNDTIEKHLTTKHKTAQNKYDKNGVYQLTCPNCEKKYTGQTGRCFKVRFQEHFRDFKHGNNRSKFAQHLLENKQ